MPNAGYSMKRSHSFYLAVFVISATVTAMQIMHSRIFSVTTWYHLSFIIISIAMFGLTLGALKIYQGDEQDQRRNIRHIAGKASIMCGVSLLLALIVQMRMPLVFSDFRWTMLALPVHGFITGMPYYFAGLALSACLTRTELQVSRVYGIDLLGAGAGCLAALALMEIIDTPSGVLVLIGMTGVAASFFLSGAEDGAPVRKTASMLIGLAAMLVILNISLPKPIFYPLCVKDGIMPLKNIDYDAWNPISRVTVTKEKKEAPPFLWGPSPKLPAGYRATYKWLIIDGDAGTVITKFDGKSWRDLQYLDYDVTNLAYHLPDLKRAAIIGIGGGRDLLSAKYFHVPEVTAIDVNSTQINLLRDNEQYRSYSSLYNQPGVSLVNSEARSWFRANRKPFDLIQMSLIDTWAATGAGAFALSENGIYTLEAWSSFLKNLSENGVFTVSRWYYPGLEGEASRQIGLAVAALLKNGIDRPQDHIFMAASGNIATMIVSRPALKGGKLALLNMQCAQKSFQILAAPDMTGTDPVIGRFLGARKISDLDSLSENLPLDLTPPTDMRPFFFNQVRFNHPLEVVRMAFADGSGTAGGHAKATFNLFIIIGFSLFMTLAVIVLPLLKSANHESASFIAAGSVYFFLIGLGFMLLEISLLQGLGVFLGHPIYGLGVVLFSLILSTGVGSLLSGRFLLRNKIHFLGWCGLVFAYSALLSLFLDDIFLAFGTNPLFERAALCVSVLAPMGFLLGYGFPTGMRLTGAIDMRSTPWFWGINGAAGVLGSAIAIAFNIAIGIDRTIMLAGVCYALLFPAMIMLSRPATQQRSSAA